MWSINKYELFCLMVLFEIGSTSLFALGIEAKQDAWISILLGLACGLILLYVYTNLQLLFPQKNLAEIIIILLGKTLGAPLVLLYSLYFIYIGSMNFREFSEFMLLSILHSTPVIWIMIAFLILVCYTLLLGPHILARAGQILLPIVLAFMLSIYAMVILSGRLELKELLPILPNGIMPVLQATFPRVINFPFGQALLFLMYWSHLDSKNDIKKISFLATTLTGILLTITIIVIISSLGVEFASQATIPLLHVIKIINIQDVITNLDALGTVIIFIGGLYKMSLFFYGSVSLLSTLFNIKNKNWLIILIGIFMLLFAYFFIKDFTFHLFLGKLNALLIHNSFQIFIPILLFCITLIKKKNKA